MEPKSARSNNFVSYEEYVANPGKVMLRAERDRRPITVLQKGSSEKKLLVVSVPDLGDPEGGRGW